MALPDLRRLALGAPTGAPLRLQELPVELQRLVTEQLLVATDQPTLCQSLTAWCKENERACRIPGLWREAFALAFGTPVHEARDWRGLFEAACAALQDLTQATGARWTSMADWTTGRLDYWMHRLRRLMHIRQINAQVYETLTEVLRVRGADAARHRRREADMWAVRDAVWYARTETVHEILDRGLVTHENYMDRWGMSMMSALAFEGVNEGATELMEALLHRGGRRYIDQRERIDGARDDPPNYRDVQDPVRHGPTPLFRVVERGAYATVRVLLDHGADPTIRCEDNISWATRTPLEEARGRMQRSIDLHGRNRGLSNWPAIIQLLEAAIAAREAAAAAAAAGP